MGKTYRKAKVCYWNSYNETNNNREEYIMHELKDDYRRVLVFGIWVDKTEEELIEARKQAEINLEERLKEYASKMRLYEYEMEYYEKHVERLKIDDDYRRDARASRFNRKPYEPIKPKLYVYTKKNVDYTKSFEEYCEEYYDEVARYYDKKYSRGKIRDGFCSESGRNKAFKKMCVRERRTKDRENVNKIKKEMVDYEDMVWHDDRDGKKYIWYVW